LCKQAQIIKANNLINSNEIMWKSFVAGDLRVGLLRANTNVLKTKAPALLYRSKDGRGGMEL